MINQAKTATSNTTMAYEATGFFNEIVLDYVRQAASIRPFYQHPVSWDGFASAMQARDASPVQREVLVQVLREQYTNAGITNSPKTEQSIELLLAPTTYTVCTAHQPNIFTGYLYVVYKILHVIKLAEELKVKHPSADFVPVYYMGSEDADLDELGKIFLNGEKLVWNTQQSGAVGRMNTKGIDVVLKRIEGELMVEPFGPALMELLKKAYLESDDMQTACFRLIHSLFEKFGLVVLIADHPELKRSMVAVFQDDLFNHTPSRLVTETINRLSDHYKVQANPRAINLFYLTDDIRNRIEKTGDQFQVVDTDIRFTLEELMEELKLFPERFSPNVILRGLYQETILPNIAFVGGGGELAYWLELKDLFKHYKVPYPVQVLRNSFLLVEPSLLPKIERLGFELTDLFQTEDQLINQLVKRDSAAQVHLTNELRDTAAFYQHLKKVAGNIDTTLEQHVSALETRMTKQLTALEKKMLRAEKRKFSDQSGQIKAIRAKLFPNHSLQERVDNILPYYAKYGPAILDKIYQESLLLEQEFIITIL